MNHHTSREVAKFLAGIACHETLGHVWLGTFGRDFLPLSFSLFTFTEEMNIACMVAWPLILAGLVWYGWLWHPRARSVTA